MLSTVHLVDGSHVLFFLFGLFFGFVLTATAAVFLFGRATMALTGHGGRGGTHAEATGAPPSRALNAPELTVTLPEARDEVYLGLPGERYLTLPERTAIRPTPARPRPARACSLCERVSRFLARVSPKNRRVT